jgi:hypothetical protein
MTTSTVEQTANTRRPFTDDDLVSTPELMTRLGISRTTVSRWRDAGLKSLGSGRLRRYKWGNVLAYLEQLG